MNAVQRLELLLPTGRRREGRPTNAVNRVLDLRSLPLSRICHRLTLPGAAFRQLVQTMKLSALLSVLPEKKVFGNQAPEITGVVYDPLRVTPGCLYVAINIYTQLDKIEIPDGHPLLPDAVRAGAVAVVLQQDQPVPAGVVKILVPDSRYALALLAVEFYRHPARSLQLIGVTGTNGKTTTTHVIESLLMTRYRAGLIGTLYYKINGRICNSKDTTPEPPDLAAIFTEMVNEKCDFCTMEVSSHAVDFHRVVGVDYQAAAWTNLSQDHLDWHKTMENYRHAKLRWLSSLGPQQHVALNHDDPAPPSSLSACVRRRCFMASKTRPT